MRKQRQLQRKPASNLSSPSFTSGQKNSSWLRSLSAPDAQIPVEPKSQHSASDAHSGLRRGFDLTKIQPHTLSSVGIQAKLTIGAPGDKYEQEADAIASQVISMSTPTSEQIHREMMPEDEKKKQEEVQTKPLAANITPLVQREITPDDENLEKEEETLQTKPGTGEKSSVQGDLEAQLQASKGNGSPLSDNVRAFMEPRFGVDFSHVKVHNDKNAVQMNQAVTAQAFTHGSDIYFGSGKYDPNSRQGQELLAHELTHVVQQTQPIAISHKLNPTALQKKCQACENEDQQIQRQPINSNKSSSGNPPNIQRRVTFDECEARQWEVQRGHDKAMEMCNNTIAKLRSYDGTNPADVKTSLQKHFHSTTHNWFYKIAEVVAANLAYIKNQAADAQYECHDQEDQGSTLAETMWCVPFSDILLYKKWFAANLRTQANTLVHEWSHRYGCTFDLGYDWEPEYTDASTFRALNNAEPYGNIVQDLG